MGTTVARRERGGQDRPDQLFPTEGGVMAAKFHIYKDARGEYRFRLKAGNGEIVATGESYPTKAGARAGCEAVQRAAADAEIVEDD
jgi:uncharacterized protein YegP (UPF0339 family)